MEKARFLVLKVLLALLMLSTVFSPLAPLEVRAHTAESPYTVPLVLGATNIPIGFVRVWNDADNLYVLIEIDEGSHPHLAMSETHLDVSKSPLSWYAPGLWPYSHSYSPYQTSDLYTIPLSDIDGGVGPGDMIYLMAHAAIRCKTRCKCICSGSAYGLTFKGSFNYTIQGPPPEEPELSILKTGPFEGYPGGTYVYTIVVENVGNSTAYNVNVTDYLPPGVTPVYPGSPGTPTGIYDSAKNTVNWSLGNLAVHDTVVITLEVLFSSGLTPGTLLTDEVEVVWGDGQGTTYGPEEAEWDTTVIAGPRLCIEKVGPVKSYPGGFITYTMTVSNIGNATAYDVTVKDALPFGYVEYVSSTPVGTVTGDGVTWNLGSLANGTSMLIALTVRVRDDVANGTQIVDHVNVTWKDSEGTGYGPEEDEWVTTVFSNPLLDISKTGPMLACPNQIVEYTISVTNLGGSDAYNVNVTDKLPAGVTYVSATPSPTSYDPVQGILNWSLGAITPGETVYVKVYVNLTVYPTEDCMCILDNSSVVWMDELSRSYGPVWDTAVTKVCKPPMLEVNKTGDAKGKEGETLVLNITITNVGGCDAIDVRIIDDLPTCLTLASSEPSYTSSNPSIGRIIWDLPGPIEPGETVRINLTVTVSSVGYDGIWVFNNVYVNWSDSETGKLYGPVTDVHPIQLFVDPYAEVAKYGPFEVHKGSTFEYTVELTNPTESQLSGVTLVDYLPDGLTYISSNPSGVYDSGAHTVTWSGLDLGPGETKVFTVKVYVNRGLPEGAFVVDEVVATWSEGSDSDILVSKILPEIRFIGGEVTPVIDLYIYVTLCLLLAFAIAVILAKTVIWKH